MTAAKMERGRTLWIVRTIYSLQSLPCPFLMVYQSFVGYCVTTAQESGKKSQNLTAAGRIRSMTVYMQKNSNNFAAEPVSIECYYIPYIGYWVFGEGKALWAKMYNLPYFGQYIKLIEPSAISLTSTFFYSDAQNNRMLVKV